MTDLLLSIIIFIILITTFFVIWNSYQSNLSDSIFRTEMELYNIQFANQLISSPGIPDNWEENQLQKYNPDGSTNLLIYFDSIDNNQVIDNSNNNNDGNLKPNPPNDAPNILNSDQCKVNNCLNFDGSNDFIEINHSSSLSNLKNFTIEFWFYPTKDQSSLEEHLIHKSGQFYIKIVNGMKPSFLINGIGQFTPNYNFNLNKWYHVALTNNHYISGFNPTNTIKFYVNGLEIFSTIAAGTPQDSSNNLYLGKQDLNQNFFPGRLDELRISNITRTSFAISPDINALGLVDKDKIINEKKLSALSKLPYEQIKNISKVQDYELYLVLLKGNQSILELGNYPNGATTKLRRIVYYQNETSTIEVSLWK
ncbi:LamG domain-containing protein [Candidatus Woesearchaeota archaeon]|nr:LamG domain-containing protein [Candidatus Woesearchaeota archaeon]